MRKRTLKHFIQHHSCHSVFDWWLLGKVNTQTPGMLLFSSLFYDWGNRCVWRLRSTQTSTHLHFISRSCCIKLDLLESHLVFISETREVKLFDKSLGKKNLINGHKPDWSNRIDWTIDSIRDSCIHLIHSSSLSQAPEWNTYTELFLFSLTVNVHLKVYLCL